jgi:hypothetical protein
MLVFQRSAPGYFSFSRAGKTAAAPFLLHNAIVWLIALYLIFSPLTLPGIGWLYGGGGSELEKIHPATYLLVMILPLAMIFDRRFRHNAVHLLLDPPFMLFVITSVSTAAYAILVKQVSAAPFVDTFLSTILVAVLTLGIPRISLLKLRTLLDVFILINVLLIFIEFATQQSFYLRYFNASTAEIAGPGRWPGLLGAPLTAAQILAAYSLTTFISSPIRSSWIDASRLVFSILALLACTLTGGRTSVGVLIGLLALYFLVSAARQIMSGHVNKLGLIYFVGGVVVAAASVPLLADIGLFDTLTARFEFDNGSGLARDFVVQILENLSVDDLWFGIDASDAAAIQQSYGLIAIEIAWANFILICGLVFTIPLFIGFCLFLFLFLPKHCAPSVVIIGAFTLILTFAYNSIWSKTTVLAITVAIVISNMRRDVPRVKAAGTSRRVTE